MRSIEIYTDGAYSNKRNVSASAFVILCNDDIVSEFGCNFTGGTNNTAELSAVILAFSCIKKPVEKITLYSDSMYVIGCGWKGWSKSKNNKHWEIFDRELNRIKNLCCDIEVVHVDGHQTDNSKNTKWNNYVDKIAVQWSHLK